MIVKRRHLDFCEDGIKKSFSIKVHFQCSGNDVAVIRYFTRLDVLSKCGV